MSDQGLGERLAKHAAVAAWLEYQLHQERRIIADLEREIAEQLKPKPVTEWVIVESWAPKQPPVIHLPECVELQDAKRTRTTNREQTYQAFYDGATVCGICKSADTMREPLNPPDADG